jgi:hypothetical protein
MRILFSISVLSSTSSIPGLSWPLQDHPFQNVSVALQLYNIGACVDIPVSTTFVALKMYGVAACVGNPVINEFLAVELNIVAQVC